MASMTLPRRLAQIKKEGKLSNFALATRINMDPNTVKIIFSPGWVNLHAKSYLPILYQGNARVENGKIIWGDWAWDEEADPDDLMNGFKRWLFGTVLGSSAKQHSEYRRKASLPTLGKLLEITRDLKVTYTP